MAEAKVPEVVQPLVFNNESLSELFSKDPESLTESEVEKIVLALRTQRVQFEAEESGAKMKGERVKHAKSQKISLSLDQLGSLNLEKKEP